MNCGIRINTISGMHKITGTSPYTAEHIRAFIMLGEATGMLMRLGFEDMVEEIKTVIARHLTKDDREDDK